MTDSRVLGRIDAWLDAGLIDGPTAARLRAAEEGADDDEPAAGPEERAGRRRPSAASTIFGPPVAVGEMFGYLGAVFLLAAWHTLMSRVGGPWNVAIAGFGAAAVLAVLAFQVRHSSPRLGRAAGVAFVVAAVHLAVAGHAVVDAALDSSTLPILIAAAVGLVSSIGFRRVHRTMLTQLGLILAVLAFAGAAMNWLEPILFGGPVVTNPVDGQVPPDSPLRVVLIAIGWGIAAVVLGLLALVEAAPGDGPGSARAALTRFAAGLTAILGTATAVFASGWLEGDRYGRLIEPWIGDGALMLVSLVLLERAFRRQASAYVYPAALGVIIGLSDLNAQYLATATSGELALLAEGGILLAAGVAFDRLRKRVGTEDPLSPVPAAA
jgi:hypothetical protein